MQKFKDYANMLLNSEEGKQKIEKIKKLESLAEYLDCTMAQLSIAWCLKNTNISCVITGASNPNQIKENVNAARFVSKLTEAICKQIEDILGNRATPELPPTWARYHQEL
jgi:aryl-alcohol dehydrogenase-like predicted oxidoreductase